MRKVSRILTWAQVRSRGREVQLYQRTVPTRCRIAGEENDRVSPEDLFLKQTRFLQIHPYIFYHDFLPALRESFVNATHRWPFALVIFIDGKRSVLSIE